MSGQRRLGGALSVSLAMHAGLALLLVIGLAVRPTPVATRPEPIKLNAVYLPLSGSVGGGGGHPAPASAKTTEVPRHELPKPPPVTPQPLPPDPVKDPLPVMDVTITTDA